jgi:hypothetical protein
VTRPAPGQYRLTPDGAAALAAALGASPRDFLAGRWEAPAPAAAPTEERPGCPRPESPGPPPAR